MSQFSTERGELLDEIDMVLGNGIMSKEELLAALLGAMETPEIRENWEYIKRCHELDEYLMYGDPQEVDKGKYDRECFV